MTSNIWMGCAAFCLSVCAATAGAAPINVIAYGASGGNIVDFEDVSGAAFPGVNYDGLLSTGGVTIGERFDGQVLGANGDLDTLSGLPNGPLTLVAGAPGENLAVGTDTGDNGLYPWGNLGNPAANGYGEGAFAVLFPGTVATFGFTSTFGNTNSSVFVDVFNAAGGLIDSLVVGVGAFGFSRDGGVQDIAGFSVYTDDPGGLGYPEIRYGAVLTTQPIPLPAGGLLLLTAFGGLAFALRRKGRSDG